MFPPLTMGQARALELLPPVFEFLRTAAIGQVEFLDADPRRAQLLDALDGQFAVEFAKRIAGHP